MERLLKDVEISLRKHFSGCRFEFLIKTPHSLKVKIHIDDDYFIALRYNARNGRFDAALIKDNQRIFGYDNLKQWHYHPYENPSEHIPCAEPSIEKIISDSRKYYEMAIRNI